MMGDRDMIWLLIDSLQKGYNLLRSIDEYIIMNLNNNYFYYNIIIISI